MTGEYLEETQSARMRVHTGGTTLTCCTTLLSERDETPQDTSQTTQIYDLNITRL